MAKAQKGPAVDADTLASAEAFLAPRNANGMVISEVRPADEPETVTRLTQHLVLIQKETMQKVPKHVFAHELPVLRAIFGIDAVIEVSQSEVDVTNFTVEDEFDRLVRVYGANNMDKLVSVYGNNPRILSDELGIEYHRTHGIEQARPQAQSLEVDNSEDAGKVPEAKVAPVTSASKPAVAAKAKPRAPASKPKAKGKK
jgi:hypothetical protein